MTIATLTAPAAPPAGMPGETQLAYDGRTGELLVLWIKVLLLGIVTLGIYSRFWGKTRIRRYFWNHVSLLGERFEYDGTGGELFRRFLLALFILPLLIGLAYGSGILLRRLGVNSEAAHGVGVALYLAAIFFLVFVSQYGSRRYQMSRTVWHGIRGGVEGSSAGYALRAIGYTLLTPFTLGLVVPWQYVGLWRYKTNHTGFGDIDFHFEGSGRKLLGPFLVAYASVILGLIVAALVGGGVFLAVAGIPHDRADIDQAMPAIIGAVVVFYLTYLFISIVGYLHFFVRAFAYTAEGTSFGRVHFAFPVRKRELFWFQLANLLLLIFTVGLAIPFVGQRYVRFFCNHLRIYGSQELKALTQAPGRRRPRGGEGLAQLFDSLDVGGFI